MEQISGDQAVQQVANVACLPGIVGHLIAMPDIRWGYGFPIGGVAAFDPDVADVLRVVDRAGIARRVVRLRPLGVLKG